MVEKAARWSGRLLLVVAVVATIGCDRVTKHVASTTLAGIPGQSYLSDTIWLGYAENTGGFLSLGADLPAGPRTIIFTVITALMLLALAVAGIRRTWGPWPTLGLALFVTGGASNWIDRIIRGSVVDFVSIGIGPLRTGIFNVADVAIMVGALLFVLTELRESIVLKHDHARH